MAAMVLIRPTAAKQFRNGLFSPNDSLNVLTALHTAYLLNMVHGRTIILDCPDGPGDDCLSMKIYQEEDDLADEDVKLIAASDLRTLIRKEDYIALTGDAYEVVARNVGLGAHLDAILVQIGVFARASPSQKEAVLMHYKSAGYHTLMCGDGTNDVGALKQADIGVALLGGKPEDLAKILSQAHQVALRKRQIEMEKSRLLIEQRWGAAARGDQKQSEEINKKIERLTGALEQEEIPLVKLGDASVAAPFTSKISTVEAVCNLVSLFWRRGICCPVY